MIAITAALIASFFGIFQDIQEKKEFEFYLLGGDYGNCIEMIKHGFSNVTEKDLNTALSLINIESKKERADEAKSCAIFIKHRLIEKKIIPHDLDARGITEIIEAARKEAMRDIQNSFLKAIEKEDLKEMAKLLKDGAKVDTTLNGINPITIAIVRERPRAIEFLYQSGVAPKTEHLELAEGRKDLWKSNYKEYQQSGHSDIRFPLRRPPAGEYPIKIAHAESICSLIAKKLSPAAASASGGSGEAA